MRERAFSGPGLSAALAACGLLLVAAPPPGATGAGTDHVGEPSRTVQARADTLLATIYRVDARADVVDVLTGVGLVVGVTRVHTVPETDVYVEGRAAGLAALRRGQLVRIEFWEGKDYGEERPGRVARSVHVVPPEDGGEGP